MRKWTWEERQRQALLIKAWKPWLSATGPTSSVGKATSKLNSTKTGLRSDEWKKLKADLKANGKYIAELRNTIVDVLGA